MHIFMSVQETVAYAKSLNWWKLVKNYDFESVKNFIIVD